MTEFLEDRPQLFRQSNATWNFTLAKLEWPLPLHDIIKWSSHHCLMWYPKMHTESFESNEEINVQLNPMKLTISHESIISRLNQMKNPSAKPGSHIRQKTIGMDLQHIFFGFSSNLPLDSKPGNDRVSGRQATAFPPIKCHLKLHPCKTWMALAITWHHQVIKPPLSHVIPKDAHRIFWKQWRNQCSTESNETHNLTWEHY